MILKNNKNLDLIVDDNTPKSIVNTKWTLIRKRDLYYACRTLNYQRIYLHRFLLGARDNEIVDHIDGNTLNNSISNLRICTAGENVRNQKLSKRNKSGYKGVFELDGLRKPYVAYISINNKRKHLGYFKTAKEAALAYNKAAIKYHKKFAKLNEVK